jgi:phosphonate transport system substrate-binding protein
MGAMAAVAMCAPTLVSAGSHKRLRIGLTPVILADQVAFLSRWGKYLSVRAGVEVEFVARDSYQSILDLLFSSQLDAAWICGYPYVRFESALQLLAVPHYQGQPVYQAYLIRPTDAPFNVNGWSDLKDRVLAYSDPLSNSGWLVAQVQLAKAGLTPRDLRKGFFTHSHRNVAEAVAARLAQAGSIDGYVWETMKAQGLPAVSKTEVVWKSEHFGFPPLVMRRNDDPLRLGKLKQALLDMQEDKVGRDLLTSLNLSAFATGAPSLFDSIRRQAQSVPGSGVVG